MNGRRCLALRPVPPVAGEPVSGAANEAERQEARDSEFKGLMALLAGCELALVDLGTGLSMHSRSAKDFNMTKAKAALETALRDFKRGNNL
jgi:hypothetical protein